jgi:hypothetical protein
VTATISANATVSVGTNDINFTAITSGYSLSSGDIVVPASGSYIVSFVTAHTFGSPTGDSYFAVRVDGVVTNPMIRAAIASANHGTTAPSQISYNSSGVLT